MLAGKLDLELVRYPCLVSPKFDGIRCIILGGIVLSRSLKPIPNRAIQERYGLEELEGIEGELIIGSPTYADVYRKTNSIVMSLEKDITDLTMYAFDNVCNPNWSYDVRLAELYRIELPSTIKVIIQFEPLDEEELLHLCRSFTKQGYEGAIIRDPHSPYKYGRSTSREGGLLKFKLFSDSEAEIIGMETYYHNGNQVVVNELGHQSRTTHKSGKVAKNLLGALVVRDLVTNVEFRVGTGFTTAQRKQIWADRDRLLSGQTNNIIKYKYFPVGVKDKPRHPVFLDFRDKRDMT